MIWTMLLPVGLYYLMMYGNQYQLGPFSGRSRGLSGDKAVVLVYTSVARHINIALAVTLSTFPLEKVPMMALLLIVGYVLQVPSLAVYAQRFGRNMAACRRLLKRNLKRDVLK